MDVIEAIHERWSVRAFTKETVGSELVDALVSAAVQAPSAMNLQPWAFVIIEGRDALQSYSDRANAAPSRHDAMRLAAFPISRPAR